MNILVSACLLGLDCRYSGSGCQNSNVLKLSEKYNLIPVCPEQLGGLPTPRGPVELANGRAVTRGGENCTAQFQKGAQEVLKIARVTRCACAVLKSRSPSCGCGKIYDGSFTGTLTNGNGITAQLLLDEGVAVYSEENCAEIKEPSAGSGKL